MDRNWPTDRPYSPHTPYIMGHNEAPEQQPVAAPPKRKARGGWIVAGVLAVLVSGCGLISWIALAAGTSSLPESTPLDPTPAATTAQGKAVPQPTPAPKVSKPTIAGDDLVHAGEDVPAGTYRARTAVGEGDLCYWVKSTDAEATKIITSDIPTGGRPQVTLKTGQWFTSQGCPDWVKQ